VDPVGSADLVGWREDPIAPDDGSMGIVFADGAGDFDLGMAEGGDVDRKEDVPRIDGRKLRVGSSASGTPSLRDVESASVKPSWMEIWR
jgi:hypothetical protein